MHNNYPICSKCKVTMEPIWFREEEIVRGVYGYYKTGRERTACSHFECSYCGEKECVDDTFDGPWISYR
jgi:hypothetical protein